MSVQYELKDGVIGVKFAIDLTYISSEERRPIVRSEVRLKRSTKSVSGSIDSPTISITPRLTNF